MIVAPTRAPRARLIAALALVLPAAGCPGEARVRTYSAPRRPPAELHVAAPTPGAPADLGPPPMPSAPRSGLAWDVPAGWREGEPRPMRVATLVLPDGLEVAITTFAGDVGGPLANVNRWRGQLGLGPIGEADLAAALVPLDGVRLPVQVLDATSEDGTRRILAALVPLPDATWFVKALGPTAQVAAARDALLAFLRTLRAGPAPAAPPAGPVGPPGPMSPPMGSPMGSPMAGDVPVGATAAPPFTTPPGWEVAPARPPQLAALRAGAGPGAPEVTITCFPGAMGDELANVNRWRGQVGLAPLAAPDGQRRAIDVGGRAGTLYELSGSEDAILVVSALVGDQTWFLKMKGRRDAVALERERFEAFARSVQLGGR